MATGFMPRHSSALLIPLLALACTGALAEEVRLVGVFGDKAAVLAIDGGPPKTVRVGQRVGGITVISVEAERATIEVDGKRRVLQRGQTYSSSGASSAAQSVTLSAGAGGHFWAEGQINGGAVRFVVDTGATAVSIPASDAVRLGIDYRSGRRGTTQTAAGPTTMFVVRLASVRVGGVELNDIDGIVIEQGLNVALLGNTFLNRMEMRREGQTMTLTKRF